MNTIHERILELIKTENISIAELERVIGVKSNSLSTALRRKSAISHEVLAKIVEKYPKYSLNWLVLGKNESPKEQMLSQITKLINGN